MPATATVEGRLRGRSQVSKLAYSLRMSRPFSVGELVVALFALGAVTALVFAPHLRHGGFHLDDWSNAATSLQPGGSPHFGSAVRSFAEFTIYRPVLVVYVPLTYFVFGMHMHYHLAWAAALAVLATTMFYGVLRTLGVPWIHALLISVLAIMFPWSDSTRLWATADQATLSIAFAAAGMLVALVGVRRTWRWHAGAVLLYLLSILSYEVTLPLIMCAGVLYWLKAGWRAARWRWLADVVAALAAGIWNGSHTARTVFGLGADLKHLKQIVEGGEAVLGRSGLPLGPPHATLVLCAVLAVLGVGLVAYRLFRDRFTAKSEWGLRNWLTLASGGIAVTVLGWVMFIPADPYYTPSIYGEANRVNVVAGFGLVLLFYGLFGIVGTLVGRVRAKSQWVAAGITILLGVTLLASYTHVLRRHIEIWDLAYAAERGAIITLQREIPRLPHGTTVFGSSYPANQVPGVPILAATWDFNGMVEMEYDDSTLSAYPILPEHRITCRAGGVTLELEGEPEVTARYGAVWLINLQSGGHSAPRSQRECRRVAHSYVPGPWYLSPSY